jgi:hypothetical protein
VTEARLGHTTLELRAVPFGGFTWIKADAKTPRPRLVAFMLGGGVANAALLGVTLWLWQASARLGLPEDPLAGFAIAQFALVVNNLIPRWARMQGTRFANDAMQVLLLMRGRHSLDVHCTYEDLLARCAPGRSPRMTAASDVLRDLIASGAARLDRHRMLAAVQPELAADAMSPEERMLTLDLLITVALTSRDPMFCRHLDDWARQLAACDPDGAATTSTRGAVLVELGHFAAGKALLETVVKPGFAASDPFDAANYIMDQAFIARAEGALGDPAAGRRRLAEARRAIGANMAYESLRPLVDRIARELRTGRYESPASVSLAAGASSAVMP